jgi:adenine-specific DNA-methyltransferase
MSAGDVGTDDCSPGTPATRWLTWRKDSWVPRYEGRLELTWTNKHERLLAHEDGSYEWLPPSDYRVAEVRLLREVEAVGEISERPAQDNLLIQGDALHALTSLIKLPAFAGEYVRKVKLAYLDPPFNTGQAFNQYDDALEHSVWLTMLRDRLLQINELLSDDGSVWVHCDDSEQHRLRSVMDEVFGPECFAGTVIWRSSDNSNNDAKKFSTDHNYIVVYAKKEAWTTRRLTARGDQVSHYANPDNDPDGPWFDGNPLNSPNPRENLRYTIESPTGYKIPPPPNGWRWSPATVKEKIASGEIRFTPDGQGIRRRTYLKDHKGLPPTSLFVDLDDTGHNRQAKSELKKLFPGIETSDLFATPKPEALIQRILQIATDPGDVVLDCFGGSGTTAAVAHKMGRRWVIVERSQETIAQFTRPRLEKVVRGADPGGVTTQQVRTAEPLPDGVLPGQSKAAAKVIDTLLKAEALSTVPGLDEATCKALIKALRSLDRTVTRKVWHGGGGFRLLTVAPSMFESDSGGMVYLADSMSNGQLAEATAAQLGYEYRPEPPFAGVKGRTRLAVVDGVVNEDVVRLLVSALEDNERVVVCGTGIDPDARIVLRELRPGSTLRKVPAALLERYRVPNRRDRRVIHDRRESPETVQPTDAPPAEAVAVGSVF